MSTTEPNRLQLVAEISSVIATGGSLAHVLRACAESLVRHLDAAFARIWTLHETEQVLELQASAGIYAHLDGPHSRVPVGQLAIGRIAQECKSHFTNSVIGDEAISDQEWAAREGMVAFAGYPLVADGLIVGVMAVFAKHSLSGLDLLAMVSVADVVAVGIQRSRTEDQLKAREAAIGALVEDVAHNFNECLTIISGYSDILLAELPPSDLRRDMVAQIRQAGERAAEVNQQLLTFPRERIP